MKYLQPTSLSGALDALEEYGTRATVMAGGSAFFLAGARPEVDVVVGLHRVPALRGIAVVAGMLRIGAMTSHREIETSSLIGCSHSLLASAFGEIGSVRIRNQATIGGNIALADPVYDPPVALLASDAVVEIAGPAARLVSMLDYLEGDRLTTGEIITGLLIPLWPGDVRARYVKVRARSTSGGPLVTVALRVRLDDLGRVADARIVLGALASVPKRAVAAEQHLLGRPLTDEIIRDAADLAVSDITPHENLSGGGDYRMAIGRVWVRRLLAETAR